MLGGILGVDRSQSVACIIGCLIEDVEGESFICWWKETLALAKGMDGASSASNTLQDRGNNLCSKNLMLLRRAKEEWTPIELKTWSSKTISGSLEDRVGGKFIATGYLCAHQGQSLLAGKE